MKNIANEHFLTNYTDSIALTDGFAIQLVEANIIEEGTIFKPERLSTITINKIGSKTIKTVIIFLTFANEYVGHISANISEENIATLNASGMRNIPLPDNLSSIRDHIFTSGEDVALFIEEKYRNKGRAKELINLMLDYLSEKGVNNVLVNGISNEAAMRTYISTGAEPTGDGNAVYRNINHIIENKKESK